MMASLHSPLPTDLHTLCLSGSSIIPSHNVATAGKATIFYKENTLAIVMIVVIVLIVLIVALWY
jgi:hypothetical protein